jgi:type IV pilus assembly protein PilO
MASFPLLEKIQKIPTKTRLIVFCGIVVFLLIAYIIQFQIPMNTEIKQLDQSLSNLRNTMQANDTKIKKLDDLKMEVSTLQERLVVLTEELPPGSEVSGLLLQIQKLVNQSGLVLKLWKPDKQRLHPSGLYEEIPISLILTGGYNNTASLFDNISKLTRIVNILNIKMGGAKVGKSGNTEVDISCTAMTFAAVEKKVEPTPKTGKKVL